MAPGIRARALRFALIALRAPTPTLAADLQPETVQTWKEYLEAVNARNQKHLVPGSSFLFGSTKCQVQAAWASRGDFCIMVSPLSPHVPMKVPSGLIHDWAGAAFIPYVTIPDVLRVVRDYERYKDIYHANVVDSKSTASSEWEDRFSLLLMNKSVIARAALDSDYRSSYTRLDDRRWYSIAETTRIQEVADYSAPPPQRTLPENEGTRAHLAAVQRDPLTRSATQEFTSKLEAIVLQPRHPGCPFAGWSIRSFAGFRDLHS